MSESVTCANCNVKYEANQCPQCGSSAKIVVAIVEDGVGLHETIKEQRGPKRKITPTSKKKRFLQESSCGVDFSHGRQKLVDKSVAIDRINNQYSEIVKDKETGEVIFSCHEPLDKHQNHGSAKFKSYDKQRYG